MVFETVVTPGRGLRGLVFVAAASLVVGGVSAGLAMHEPAPFLVVLVGAGLFVWLVRSEPKAVYAEYLRIDGVGIKYSHTPDASGRVSLYSWNEIESVSVSSDPSGITVFTSRPGMKGVGIFLLTLTHADAQSAVALASERLMSCSQ